ALASGRTGRASAVRPCACRAGAGSRSVVVGVVPVHTECPRWRERSIPTGEPPPRSGKHWIRRPACHVPATPTPTHRRPSSDGGRGTHRGAGGRRRELPPG